MATVNFLGCKVLTYGESKRGTIGFVEVLPEITTEKYINHHILLADVSGSMSSNIITLREKVTATLKALTQIPDSYVSVITYSGHGQSKRVVSGVKCEETSYRMADVWRVIEEEFRIKSVTVISEPLEQSIQICKSLAGVCSKHHIALFTDGCLVPTHWDEETEREKCLKIAEICCQEGIFLNAVGFGQYYDRAFLRELAEAAGNGAVIHIDEVHDYSEVILNIIRKVNEEKLVSVDLCTSEGTLFSLSGSIMKSTLHIRNFNENHRIFAVINSPSVQVDRIEYPLQPQKEADNQELLDTFYYSLARYYLQEEDVDNMEFVIKTLGDLALYERVQNCYSFTEKGNAIGGITEVLEDKSKRFAKGRNPITINPSEKLCILEILRGILQDQDSELYWDTQTPYHRITQHTRQSEDTIIFKKNDTRCIPVTSISIGSEKLNIGVKVRIDGEVLDTTSGFKKEACIYRDYNIVNSGNINVPYINARLSKGLYDKFSSEGVLTEVDGASYNTGNIYTINLQGIKSTNKRILRSMPISEIVENLYRIAELKCRQWAINQYLKELSALGDTLSFAEMSNEEQELRRVLRIDQNGIYSPASIEKDTDSPFEIYPAVFMTWDILRFPEASTKARYLNELKEIITTMKYTSGKDDQDVHSYLSQELSQVRSDMRSREIKVNSVRIASAITGKSPFMWEEVGEKTKTSTDKVLNRNMVVGGKLTYSRKYIGSIAIEQQKWVQLIKCN